MAGEIWQELKLNRLTIPNRIFRSAHGTHFVPGQVSDKLIDYHYERGLAGVGLSMLEIASVHPSSFCMGLHSWDDSIIARYAALMDRVRPTGMRIFQQIWHGGAIYPTANGGAPWSASDVCGPWSNRRPRAMTVGEIDLLVECFGEAARRAVEGGLDGVEVQLGHGYLLHQFLSPVTNLREDEYGGSFENRMRFAERVVRRVREVVGPDFTMGIRISDELTPGGNNASDCAQVVERLETDGLIDFVNGAQSTYYRLDNILPAMDKPTGSLLPSAATIVRGASKLPRLITPGRIRTIEEAEQIIRDGTADMVSIVRAMIAEPDLIAKTKAGIPPRPCIACNQGCVGSVATGGALGCTVNPVIGQEATMAERLIVPTDAAQRVVVVGGGPGGMEAARIAAISGHKVTLFEAGPDLGGLAQVARTAPKLHVLGDFIDWQEGEVFRLGVDVRLNSYVEADEVLAEEPDAVIVTTGSLPEVAATQIALPGVPIEGTDLPHVFTSVDLLTAAQITPGSTALLFDDVGHYEAVAAAEYLIEKGVDVIFATRFAAFAPQMETTIRNEPALARLQARPNAFRLMTRMHVERITPEHVELRPLQADRIETVAADLVVMVQPRKALRDLYDSLLGKVPYLAIAGDADAPADMQVAVREAHLAARAIPARGEAAA